MILLLFNTFGFSVFGSDVVSLVEYLFISTVFQMSELSLVTAGNLYVHSFYNNQDQLRLQNQHFRNRTSLFKDQISRGNASLQLTGVEVQDQGGYRCYTRTMRGNKDSFINLRVDGMRDTQEIHKDISPVSKVNMEQVGNRIICSSEGIYPEPDLTWSTSPLSNLTLQNQTSIQQTEQQLYNISSSLILSDSETDLIYICTISTRSNSRNTTFFIPSNLYEQLLSQSVLQFPKCYICCRMNTETNITQQLNLTLFLIQVSH
uniref:Ig-like domain-containing protein n=1 Tax=Lates calcarifer TaxID=8187 RepID=A0A4W6G2R4_LATCA